MNLLSRHRPPSAVDLDAVRRVAGAVRDPELHLGLQDAGMLGEVRVDRAGKAHVTVRLTTATCPMRDQLVAEVGAAVDTVPGVTGVQVTFETMSEGERIQLATRLRGGRESGHPFGPQSATAVYAVASGKGGVGKSTVTANLAVALAQQGKRVGVLDADVWGWSIPQLFGVRHPPVALKGLMLPLQVSGRSLGMSQRNSVSTDEILSSRVTGIAEPDRHQGHTMGPFAVAVLEPVHRGRGQRAWGSTPSRCDTAR